MIIFITGIIIGAIISIGVMELVYFLVIEPRGLVAKWFLPEQLLRIFAAFAVIVGILQIPVLIAINKIKTIDLMED